MHIKDKCFLISGGGSGLGAATARTIIQEGGQVVIADLNQDAGAALATELGPRAHFILTDVSDEALETWCCNELTGAARPRRFARFAALPRNALGKLDRQALRDLVRQKLE